MRPTAALAVVGSGDWMGLLLLSIPRSNLAEKYKDGAQNHGQTEEVAHAVLLMAQSNAWMTGGIFDVNGASYFRT